MRGHILVVHLPGVVMVADLLTKAPAHVVFLELMLLIQNYAADGIVVIADAAKSAK